MTLLAEGRLPATSSPGRHDQLSLAPGTRPQRLLHPTKTRTPSQPQSTPTNPNQPQPTQPNPTPTCKHPRIAMWDDEDNNPYGSFARHDSNSSDAPGLASPTACKASMMLPSNVQCAELAKCRTAPPRRRPRRRRLPTSRPSTSRSGT